MKHDLLYNYVFSLFNNCYLSVHSPVTPTQDKYIVYEDCLLSLFRECPTCGRSCEITKFVRGTFLSINQKCHFCEYGRKWDSQPIIGSTPAGNIHLSAAVYFTGSSFIQMNKVWLGCFTINFFKF